MTFKFQAFPLDADGNTGMDTHNTTVTPVIVVPGVMGTRVQLRGPAAPMWDPDTQEQMLLWTALNAREKSVLLNPAATKGEPFPTFSSVARGEVRASNVKDIAAREDPSVIPRKVTGRSNEAIVADQRLMQYYQRRGWASLVWGFYGSLLMRLEVSLNEGSGTLRYPVYASGYDWRKSNIDNGARLASELDAILRRHPLAKQVVFVTHSMGGLVMRAALPQIEPKVRGVVHCVIPADGAAVAYRRFHSGANTPFDAPQSAFPGALEVVAQKVLNRIMGSDAVSYALVQSGLRGPVELLPSNNYATVFLETVGGTNLTIGDIYATYATEGPPGIVPKAGSFAPGPIAWTPADAAELRARIDGARTLHAKLLSNFHPNTFAIFGDGLRTDTHFNWNVGIVGKVGDDDDLRLKVTQFAIDDDPDNPNIKVTGDGTVPTISARATALPKERRFRVNGAEHAACYKEAAFMKQLEACLFQLL